MQTIGLDNCRFSANIGLDFYQAGACCNSSFSVFFLGAAGFSTTRSTTLVPPADAACFCCCVLLVVMLITGAGADTAAGCAASSSPVNCLVTNPPTAIVTVLTSPIRMLFNEPPEFYDSSAILINY